jgi:hypothetical protein
MITSFNLNAYFYNIKNFEYNEYFPEIEATNLVNIAIEEIIEEPTDFEMEELSLIQLIMLPYEHRDVVTPHPETPPSTPAEELDYEDDDEDEGIVQFTDVCDETLVRPIPISAVLEKDQ